MNGGLDGEKDFFLWGDMGMDEGISAMASEEKRTARERREEKRREKRIGGKHSPQWRFLSRCTSALPLHCIGNTARRKMRASATIYGFAREQSLAANLPSRQAIVTRPLKRLIMDDGGECKHAHL